MDTPQWLAKTIPERSLMGQRPGEAQLMPVGISDVEEALPPGGITWRIMRVQAQRERAPIKGIDVIHVQNNPPPPSVRRLTLGGQIEKPLPELKAGKGGGGVPIAQPKPHREVKTNRPRHIGGPQSHRAQRFDMQWVIGRHGDKTAANRPLRPAGAQPAAPPDPGDAALFVQLGEQRTAGFPHPPGGRRQTRPSAPFRIARRRNDASTGLLP